MAKKTPQNLVGHKVPTVQEVAPIRAKIAEVRDFARSLGPMTAKEERKGGNRFRKGGETMAELTLTLTEKYGLNHRNYTVSGIRADMALAKEIEVAVKEAYFAWLHLRDIYNQARTEAWDGVMNFHGALCQQAETDPELAAEVEPNVQFMARKPTPADEKEEEENTDETLG
jgi:hypothetical protein